MARIQKGVKYIFDCGCTTPVVRRMKIVCKEHSNPYIQREYVCKHGIILTTTSKDGPAKTHCDKCKKEKKAARNKTKPTKFKKIGKRKVKCICPGTKTRECGKIHFKVIQKPDCSTPRIRCTECANLHRSSNNRSAEYERKRVEREENNQYVKISDILSFTRFDLLEFNEFDHEYGKKAIARKKALDIFLGIWENSQRKQRIIYG